jgi:hypothetical protein
MVSPMREIKMMWREFKRDRHACFGLSKYPFKGTIPCESQCVLTVSEGATVDHEHQASNRQLVTMTRG